MNHKVLIVEDDISVNEMMKEYLEKEGYKVTSTFEGQEGLHSFQKHPFDLVILDIMMPKLDGIEVLKKIRFGHTIPVLIVSAKDTDVEKVLGLELGADDYITKPFSMIELSARVKAAIRRSTSYLDEQKEKSKVQYKDLTIDIENYLVEKNGKLLNLTSKEFEILKLFLNNPKSVFTKAQIYNSVWNEDYYGDENVINTHISRLRDKLNGHTTEFTYIKTIWGIGYKLND